VFLFDGVIIYCKKQSSLTATIRRAVSLATKKKRSDKKTKEQAMKKGHEKGKRSHKKMKMKEEEDEEDEEEEQETRRTRTRTRTRTGTGTRSRREIDLLLFLQF
jgi:hypothetical protein